MNKLSTFLSTLLAFFGLIAGANAQCAAGEVAVTAEVTTDQWGYELYWEITPDGDDCGVNTIASFGNVTVGCAGGAAQAAGPDPSAYDNNAVVTEDLGCMTDGVCVTIYTVDDWGDGSSQIQLYVDGIVADLIVCTGAGDTTSFCPSAPASFDASVAVGPGTEYTIVPVSQTTPIGGSATITNSGGDVITNATVTSTVSDGAGNVVYTETSDPVASIAVGATADVTVAGYTPTMVDTYTIEYAVSITEADAEASNDAVQTTFVVSDSVYARDNGVVEGGLGFNADATNPVVEADLGQAFEVVATDTLSSVSMLITNTGGSNEGTVLTASIYEVDATTGEPTNEIGTTAAVTIDATENAFWDCPILNGLILNPGTYVIVANQPADNLGLGYTSSIFTEGTTWNQSTTLATGWANNETYNFLVSFLLRANFGEVVESTVGLDEENSSEISIYPNPSTGSFNLNISNLNAASVDVEITDVSGKVILNNTYNTTNGSVNESINISNVDEGVYIVRVNGGQSIVKRIVISNK